MQTPTWVANGKGFNSSSTSELLVVLLLLPLAGALRSFLPSSGCACGRPWQEVGSLSWVTTVFASDALSHSAAAAGWLSGPVRAVSGSESTGSTT